MNLQAHVDRYVALKRHLGYKFVNNERILRSWAAFPYPVATTSSCPTR